MTRTSLLSTGAAALLATSVVGTQAYAQAEVRVAAPIAGFGVFNIDNRIVDVIAHDRMDDCAHMNIIVDSIEVNESEEIRWYHFIETTDRPGGVPM